MGIMGFFPAVPQNMKAAISSPCLAAYERARKEPMLCPRRKQGMEG